MGLLRALGRDLATPVLMVTHDPRTHAYADRLLWLEEGKLRPVSHDELVARGIGGSGAPRSPASQAPGQ
jgi:ABC-type lipoprotein export system ATPase subunit